MTRDDWIHDSDGRVPLQNLPRFSTETQQRNGFRQSRLENRGDRILEDIQNGNYTCAICIEPITKQKVNEAGVWNCDQCHNVWHFSCAKTWSQSDSARSAYPSMWNWKCPGCSGLHDFISVAKCWCGKERHSAELGRNHVINSCGKICDKRSTCPFGDEIACPKECHPGPHPEKCVPTTCTHLLPKHVGLLGRAVKRLNKRQPGTLRMTGFVWLMLTCLYLAFGTLLSLNIRWWTMPYIFPHFKRQYDNLETSLIVLLGSFVFMPLLFIIILGVFDMTREVLQVFFNIAPRVDKPPKRLPGLFLDVILFLVCTVIFIIPPVALIFGVDIAWYGMMKDSCAGYSTRIDFTDSKVFQMRSLSPGVKSDNMFMSSYLQPSYNSSSRNFEFYHRLSLELQNGTFVAVDIDTRNHIWRVQQLSQFDKINKWKAHGRNFRPTDPELALFGSLPDFLPTKETTMLEGTMTKVNPMQQDMYIPELDFVIGNMWLFTQGCANDPFIRVFNTHGLQAMQEPIITPSLQQTWNGKGEKDPLYPFIEMRTAAFGHGRTDLTICMKDGFESADGGRSAFDGANWRALVSRGEGDGDGDGRKGMREDLLVPMAVLAAFRQRLQETGGRSTGKSCIRDGGGRILG